jgi:hypothetical protein
MAPLSAIPVQANWKAVGDNTMQSPKTSSGCSRTSKAHENKGRNLTILKV